MCTLKYTELIYSLCTGSHYGSTVTLTNVLFLSQQSHWPQHMSVCGQNSDGGGGGEGGPDSINGEASAHSSRVSTPVQNMVAAQVSVLYLCCNYLGVGMLCVACSYGFYYYFFLMFFFVCDLMNIYKPTFFFYVLCRVDFYFYLWVQSLPIDVECCIRMLYLVISVYFEVIFTWIYIFCVSVKGECMYMFVYVCVCVCVWVGVCHLSLLNGGSLAVLIFKLN